MTHKQFQFKLTTVNPTDGTFEGLLSTYGNVDLGGDVVEPGAFAKTLHDCKGQIPMLWQHNPDQPIGMMDLKDSDQGLMCTGTLALEVPQAQTCYALLKRGIVKGLSIGYRAVQDTVQAGVRHLKEIQLFEGSVVTFPMNLQAMISAVKAAAGTEHKDDFNTELLESQLYAARYMMLDAIGEALMEIRCDDTMTAETKVTASHESIQQFESAYCEMLPQYLAMIAADDDGPMQMMSERRPRETKAGRAISASTCKSLQAIQDTHQAAMKQHGQACKQLQALLDGAAKSEPATIDHSEELLSFKDSLLGAFVQ